MDCIYLELKKAFDKVPHRKLISKLEYIGGVKGRLLEWMKDYLVGKQVSTVVRGVKST